MTLGEICGNIVRFVFPERCIICGEITKKSDSFGSCSECMASFEGELEKECPACNNTVADCKCISHRLDIFKNGFAAIGFYRRSTDTTGQLLMSFKHRQNSLITSFLAEKLANAILEKYPYNMENTVVVNPPRSKSAKRKYGFDQGELLGQKVAEILGCEYVPAVKRHSGKTQKALGANERKKNAGKSFAIINTDRIFAKDIIVIDDVITTGATFEAVTSILRENGVKTVFPAPLFIREQRDELWFE